MASLGLGSSSANSGSVDDNPGLGILDAGERFRLFGIAKDRTRYGKDRILDVAILLRRCPARHDASGDYRCHDAFSSRCLSLLVVETICGFRQRA